MTTLTATGKKVNLTSSLVYSNLLPVPAWGAPRVTRVPSGAEPTVRVNPRIVTPSEPCFITNNSSFVHEQVQWLADTEFYDKSNNDRFPVFLRAQGVAFFRSGFHHPSNFVNLDVSLYAAMHKHELFAVTCSSATLDALAEILLKQNEIAKTKEGYTRMLQVAEVSKTVEYDIVVLQPKHFLPNRSPLIRHPDPANLDQTPQFYQLDDDGVLRVAPATKESPPFPPFRFTAQRRQVFHNLNPYIVILAADLKFRRFKALPNPPTLHADYEALISKTARVAELIYYEPELGVNAHFFFGVSLADGDEGSDDDTDSMDNSDEESPGSDLRSLISGRDLPLTSDDRALLREMKSGPSQSQPS